MPELHKPRIIAVVDTEERFHWDAPFSREATDVSYMHQIGRLQEIFDRFAVKPVYVCDYPVATQEAGWRPLREIAESGRAVIGAHLHPWVTPPYEEELSRPNSYAGNLPGPLEYAKISVLTEALQKAFGSHPRFYKAGRYGIGPNTFRTLAELGYEADLSPAPPLDFRDDSGPDFTEVSCWPYRDEASGIAVIPGTGAFHGWLPGDPRDVRRWASGGWRKALHLNGILYHARALRRTWLTPESFGGGRMALLTRHLMRGGLRTFVISLHSSVIVPGATQFARDEAGVTALLQRLSDYFEIFMGQLGGEPGTIDAAIAELPVRVMAARA